MPFLTLPFRSCLPALLYATFAHAAALRATTAFSLRFLRVGLALRFSLSLNLRFWFPRTFTVAAQRRLRGYIAYRLPHAFALTHIPTYRRAFRLTVTSPFTTDNHHPHLHCAQFSYTRFVDRSLCLRFPRGFLARLLVRRFGLYACVYLAASRCACNVLPFRVRPPALPRMRCLPRLF